MENTKVNAICGVCPGGCAIEAEVKDGVLVDVKPNKEAPFGTMCIRGKAAAEIVYSKDRINKPLIRIGKRGEGKFREAEWDEALDYVTDKMKELKNKYGAESIISHSGRGVFEQSFSEIDNVLGTKFLWEFGSPNVSSVGSLCYQSFGVFAPMTTYGLMGYNIEPEYENTNLIVIWGANPVTDSPPFSFHQIMKAKEQGKKIIVIDHMKSDIAKRADEWIPIRSGTDGALALGVINVIIQEKLYDKEFIEKWTVGFKELKEYVTKFTPEEVERITKVPKDRVVSLAREIATANHATLRTYTGLEYTNSGVQNIRAVYILWALSGNIDVPGGIYFKPQSVIKKDIKKPSHVKAIGASEYPVFYDLTDDAQFMEFPKAVLDSNPYKIRGLLNIGSSILTSYPQPNIYEKAFKELDLMVVIDRFMTKDALFADVVLPATTHFEIDSYQRYPGYARLRRKVIEPVGQARNDMLILGELANRLGFGHLYPQTEEEIIEKAFSGNPELLKKLRESEDGVEVPIPECKYKKYESGLLRGDGKAGFPTKSGKLEIYSEYLESYGYDPLPKYIEPIESPLKSTDIFKDYPLILNTGARIHSTFRSQHLNIPSLLKLQEKPLALMNPEDAVRRRIENGDRIKVKTKRGEVYFYADVSDKVLPGTVEVNQGGGSPIQVDEWKEGNVNYLTDLKNRDNISGFPVLKALLCEIAKA
ncbi:molybdopterin oxidoreductase BisC [Gottschalkia acidurici 9a]|uniref:Molybdopterin oxidoreductase BisC n=1 Tax=Gottschalkia acidurici (strain ATCC 7906 / DSM 604 / BCRC 14475 / CIP 104303 / KCTC 5404 / NCIMB 10678 / 9a) TaxID=1128398 RepID=K0B418_GOTA9|nr:molybdopterin-dependent oxidoreductase [Gottschalkia acidurici]AFS79675.1 molybdopterin oxidoreductase BisC [Gottschalkia acidurici 9a]